MTVAKFCPECGTPTQGAKFCPECGTATAVGHAVSAEPTAPTYEAETEVWRGTPDPLLSPVAARTSTYVLTNRRLNVTSGLLGRKGESLELFRVKDVSVKKSLTQRTRGRGDLVIRSTDPSTPELKLESVPDPDGVAETVRGLVEEARRKHNIILREGL